VDWIINDELNLREMGDLLTNGWVEQIGIACNCHINYGEFCIVEVGKNVKAKVPEHDDPMLYNGRYVEMEKMQRDLSSAPMKQEFGENYLPAEFRGNQPVWFDEDEPEHMAWLKRNFLNFNKLQLREFSTKNDPECRNMEPTFDNEFCNAQEIFPDDPTLYTNTESERLGAQIFLDLQALRADPASFGATSDFGDLSEQRQFFIDQKNAGNLPELKWSVGLQLAIAHWLGEQGPCGTQGDANSDYLDEIYRKHYAFWFDNL
jgi:hypothetical protein